MRDRILLLSVIKTSSLVKRKIWTLFCCGRFGKISAMFWALRHVVGWISSALGSRKDLILENLVQHLFGASALLQWRQPKFPKRYSTPGLDMPP